MEKVDVLVDGALSMERASGAVVAAAETLGIVVSSRCTLAAYPESIHWHLMRPGRKGVLEVTVTSDPRRMWVSYHANRVGDGWVRDIINHYVAALLEHCS